jgi:hypothetical protein
MMRFDVSNLNRDYEPQNGPRSLPIFHPPPCEKNPSERYEERQIGRALNLRERLANNMTRTLNNLCHGFKYGKTGDSGRCICGLHWRGEMPPHDSSGILLDLECATKHWVTLLEMDVKRANAKNGMLTMWQRNVLRTAK